MFLNSFVFDGIQFSANAEFNLMYGHDDTNAFLIVFINSGALVQNNLLG